MANGARKVVSAIDQATPGTTNAVVASTSQTTPGTTDRVTAGLTTVVDVTLSLDTNVYASGEVLADTQVVTNATRVADLGGVINTLTLVDKDDQGAALDLWLFDANVAMGTENAAPSISDANAASLLGRISVATTDYIDLGGAKVATFSNLGIPVKPATGTRNIYIAAVNGTGTPTYTAAGLVARFGVLQD